MSLHSESRPHRRSVERRRLSTRASGKAPDPTGGGSSLFPRCRRCRCGGLALCRYRFTFHACIRCRSPLLFVSLDLNSDVIANMGLVTRKDLIAVIERHIHNDPGSLARYSQLKNRRRGFLQRRLLAERLSQAFFCRRVHCPHCEPMQDYRRNQRHRCNQQ